MPLKLKVETLDDVDEAHRSLYKKSGDNFILDVDGIDALQKQAADERKAREATLINSEIDKALTAAGAIPGLKRGAALLIRQQCKVVADGDNLKVTAGDEDLADYVRSWSAADGRQFILPAKGGDANPGGVRLKDVDGAGPNPWSRAQWNMTMQGAILAQGGARATRLARLAGHVSPIGAKREHAR